MTLKEYEISVIVSHTVFVEAEDADEAEELAYDQFIDDQSYWDDVDFDILGVMPLEDDEDVDEETT